MFYLSNGMNASLSSLLLSEQVYSVYWPDGRFTSEDSVRVRCAGVVRLARMAVRLQPAAGAGTQCAASGHPCGGATHASYSHRTSNSPLPAR